MKKSTRIGRADTDMELLRGIHTLTAKHRPSVVSIGNYDGVHLGHQHVINTLLLESDKRSAPSTVVTFEPLAKEFFMPDSVVRLTTIEERAELLFALGVDRVLCIDFTADFAAYSPLGFVDDVLIKGLDVQYLCVGDDFRFGKDRAGDFNFLRNLGRERGFDVNAHDTFEISGERVSSGRVRDALLNDDFSLAETLLGRPYSISGSVAKGEQMGRTIDYPTANIVLPEMVLPVNGVYAVKAELEGVEIDGVANVGKRPTVNGRENRLEVHLFDFDRDIYDLTLKVRFIERIREEQRFDSFEALKTQIHQDAHRARTILTNN